jgi:hypothetical protein
MFVALGMQHVMRMHRIFICGLVHSTEFFHFVSQMPKLSKKVIEHKMCVLIFCTTLCETFIIPSRIQRDSIRSVHRSSCTVPIFLSDFNKTFFSRQNFEKYSSIKFHDIPSSGSRVVPCGRTDRQT